MLYHPELIVYLWLLPVTFLVVVPAILATMRSLLAVAKSRPQEDIPVPVFQQ